MRKGKVGDNAIMLHPSSMLQSSRSQAWLCCGQRLAVGNPRGYCKRDVLEDDAMGKISKDVSY